MKTLWEKGAIRVDCACFKSKEGFSFNILPAICVCYNKTTRYFYGGLHITFRWLFFYFVIAYTEECLLLQEEKKKAGLL